MRASALTLALCFAGCEASFVDLRPELGAGEQDGGFPKDAGSNPGTAKAVARGSFSGRGGYDAEGTGTLVMEPDGSFAVELSADFAAVDVPGPFVVLSRRSALGTQLDAAQDVELGALQSNRGAQRYAVPAGADDRRFLWVYCKPFGVEVARAELQEVP